MTQRRKFTAEFKAQVVLDLVSGAKSAAELCRGHQLNPQLLARGEGSRSTDRFKSMLRKELTDATVGVL